jgi:hypothetical protein
MAIENDQDEIGVSQQSSDEKLLNKVIPTASISKVIGGTGIVECPVCGAMFEPIFRRSRCPNGHEFDVVTKR